MRHYLPLRVRSVYSLKTGAVRPAELSTLLRSAGINYLPVCDQETFLGWEYFKNQADREGLKFIGGVELTLSSALRLLFFPMNETGYFEMLTFFRTRQLTEVRNCALIVLLYSRESGMLKQLLAGCERRNIFFGLEWSSPSWLPTFARQLGVPLVWAEELCWLKSDLTWRVLVALRSQRPLQEELARKTVSGGYILPVAIDRRWAEVGRIALKNNLRLAEMVQFEFKLNHRFIDNSNDQILRRLVNREILRRRLTNRERQRLESELMIIEKMGFSFYFLVVARLAAFCRRQKIAYNLRGSAASSFLLYILGVNAFSPLDFNLLFERFINSRRLDLPDIDLDFSSIRRPEVFRWVLKNYALQTAFVATHKFYAARSALYDIARASGLSPQEAISLTKKQSLYAEPETISPPDDPQYELIFHAARSLQGVLRDLALHVGGVVITPRSVAEIFPLTKSPGGLPQLLWDKMTVERLNFFKLDLLAVRGMQVLEKIWMERNSSQNDRLTWDLIQSGQTIGCFQLESPLMRENLCAARPTNIIELANVIAIIRPGPARSGMKVDYHRRAEPRHPLFARLFPLTRGMLIYEEQISILLSTLTGWRIADCELVRRDLKRQRAAGWYSLFVEDAQKRGWKREEIDFFWKLIGDFSLYAFCQAHSVSYAYVAYYSAYFKAHQPLHFFATLLNAGGGYYPLSEYVAEARRCAIRLLPPDVNRSQVGFTVENGALRCGLIFVRGIGPELSRRIIERRQNGYESIFDFVQRTGASQTQLAHLAALNAFQSIDLVGYSPAEVRLNERRLLGFELE